MHILWQGLKKLFQRRPSRSGGLTKLFPVQNLRWNHRCLNFVYPQWLQFHLEKWPMVLQIELFGKLIWLQRKVRKVDDNFRHMIQSLLIFSESPTKGEYIWAPLMDRNVAPDTEAMTLTSVVLLHPGGPNRSMPLGGFNPSLLNVSMCKSGHSVACLSFYRHGNQCFSKSPK